MKQDPASFQCALNTILESEEDDITPEMVKELYATTTSDKYSKYKQQQDNQEEASVNEYMATTICELKLANGKQEKNQVLIDMVKKCSDVKTLNRLFVLAREIEDLNQHRHPVWDYIRGFGFFTFTWKPINTKTWRDTMGEIRQHALEKLEEESKLMRGNNDFVEQAALLKWAETAEIFAAHRNNSIFAKAWGDTKTVEKIKLIPRLK